MSLALVVFAAIAFVASASDPDPVADFAITSGKNGGPVTGEDFALRAFSTVSIAAGAGAGAKSSSVALFPAIATQGISFTFVNYAPCGQNAIHTHPRATELLYLIEGQLNVGFVDTNNTLYSATIYAGDVFLFPRGLIHFQTNPDAKHGAKAIAALNSQNPGAQRIGSALFLPSAFPTNVVQRSFNAEASAIEAIKQNFPANGNPVGTANTGCDEAGAQSPAGGRKLF